VQLPVRSKVLEILIFADEFMHMPVRRTDELPLQRLAMDLRLEVDTKARMCICHLWFSEC